MQLLRLLHILMIYLMKYMDCKRFPKVLRYLGFLFVKLGYSEPSAHSNVTLLYLTLFQIKQSQSISP